VHQCLITNLQLTQKNLPKNDFEFIAWINQLDDPYKAFLFSIINAIFLFAFLSTGINIDPDALRELIIEKLIFSLDNEILNTLWNNLLGPILLIFGIIQVIISLYAIYKYKILGLLIAAPAFFGMLGLLYTSSGLPGEIAIIWVVMIGFSLYIARRNSKLDFDRNGKVISD